MNILGLDDGWSILLTSVLTYITIIAFVRLSGKRSTSQMNNFDWVVTVTLGSISASMILLDDVSWAEGALAMASLLVLQFSLTWGVRRFAWLARLVKAQPATLVEGGRFCDSVMADERVSRAEVMAALRDHGFERLEHLDRVVLETDATFSVIADSRRTSSDG